MAQLDWGVGALDAVAAAII